MLNSCYILQIHTFPSKEDCTTFQGDPAFSKNKTPYFARDSGKVHATISMLLRCKYINISILELCVFIRILYLLTLVYFLQCVADLCSTDLCAFLSLNLKHLCSTHLCTLLSHEWSKQNWPVCSRSPLHSPLICSHLFSHSHLIWKWQRALSQIKNSAPVRVEPMTFWSADLRCLH